MTAPKLTDDELTNEAMQLADETCDFVKERQSLTDFKDLEEFRHRFGERIDPSYRFSLTLQAKQKLESLSGQWSGEDAGAVASRAVLAAEENARLTKPTDAQRTALDGTPRHAEVDLQLAPDAREILVRRATEWELSLSELLEQAVEAAADQPAALGEAVSHSQAG